MAQKQQQQQALVVGEQLTGLSPTVCRRAIAALRQMVDEQSEGSDNQLRHVREALVGLLSVQTTIDCGTMKGESLTKFLDACEKFLDVVEGKTTPAQEQPPK